MCLARSSVTGNPELYRLRKRFRRCRKSRPNGLTCSWTSNVARSTLTFFLSYVNFHIWNFNGAFQWKRNSVALRDQYLRWHQSWNEPESDKHNSRGVVAVLQAVRGSKYSHVARSIPVYVVSSEAIYIFLFFVFRNLLVQRRISCVGSRSSLWIWLCSYLCCSQRCG